MKPNRYALVALMLLLGGCATLYNAYSVDESTLETYLRQQVTDFNNQQQKSGIPVSVSLQDVNIILGPGGRNVAILNIEGDVAMHAFLARLPVNVSLSVQGTPIYDAQTKAVYIRNLKMLSSHVDSPFFSGELQPLADGMMQTVSKMLATLPVYRLDQSNLLMRLSGGAGPAEMTVKPGRLVFTPAP